MMRKHHQSLCDVCGKRYKTSGLKTHKAVHKKNK